MNDLEHVSESAMSVAAMDGVAALRSAFQRVNQAAEKAGRVSDQIRVVAVSKTKPDFLIRQVYDAGHSRHRTGKHKCENRINDFRGKRVSKEEMKQTAAKVENDEIDSKLRVSRMN